MTKVAETDINLSNRELLSLLEVIRTDPAAYKVKDGHCYELKVGESSTPVDLDKVPEKFNSLFTKLKSEMKIIK